MKLGLTVGVMVVVVAAWAGCVGSLPDDSNPVGDWSTGSPVPELGTPVSVSIISESYVDADVHVLFFVGPVEVHRTDLRVPARSTMRAIGPDLATRITVEGSYVEGGPTPSADFLAGRDFESGQVKEYIIPDALDTCPDDPDKREAGICGCGVADTDTDADGTPDCIDACLQDSGKTAPGVCGCGLADIDTDGDGILDCLDGCPLDKDKTAPGACGCGVSDLDRDRDGTLDCLDGCPDDPKKTAPGSCGCGVSDRDSDGDGVRDCHDGCPSDRNKTSPGLCGCGKVDTPGCDEFDYCPEDPYKTEPGVCGCGVPDVAIDSDRDGVFDCVDYCPDTISGVQVDEYGCSTPRVKADFDGDGDVDQSDFAKLQSCLGQESVPQQYPSCLLTDLDQNGFTDGADLALFWCYLSGEAIPAFRDCNGNGIHDCEDLQASTSSDLDGNGRPDECDIQACCSTFGECAELPLSVCISLEGVPQGAGSTCAEAHCVFEQLVACCLCDEVCEEMSAAECVYRGGWVAGESCSQESCAN
ncbi:MAG: hypothetical protein KA354_00300 [Phycisphaerae bacterium]|nr:hypothetical protein [Phycisphaerae bacterium]